MKKSDETEDAKPADTARPWGDRAVASGVEVVFLWAKGEIAAMEERGRAALDAAHQRITDLEARQKAPPAPTAPDPAREKTKDAADKKGDRS